MGRWMFVSADIDAGKVPSHPTPRQVLQVPNHETFIPSDVWEDDALEPTSLPQSPSVVFSLPSFCPH